MHFKVLEFSMCFIFIEEPVERVISLLFSIPKILKILPI